MTKKQSTITLEQIDRLPPYKPRTKYPFSDIEQCIYVEILNMDSGSSYIRIHCTVTHNAPAPLGYNVWLDDQIQGGAVTIEDAVKILENVKKKLTKTG